MIQDLYASDDGLWSMLVSVLANILLGLMVIVVGLLVLTFLMNIFLRVPSVPTPMPVVQEMVRLAHLQNGEVLMDLGAGDGRLLIEAKRACPGITARGYELIPLIWLIGRVRILISKQQVRLHLGNMLYCNLHDPDVVFLYLFPSIMERLTPKFTRELRPGTRIISYMFRLPGHEPVETKVVKGFWGEAKVFVYQW